MEKSLAKSVEPFFEKVEKLSKVQRVVISGLVFALIVGIFVYLSYWPKLERIKQLNTEIEKLEKKIKTARRNAADLKKFQAKMKEAELQFRMAMKKLPEKEEIPSLLTSISDSGQQAGLEFLLFEPKPETKKGFYAEIPVVMNIKGDYHNMAIFFDQVARLSRIVNIQNIQISKSKAKEGGSRKLSTSCMAVTYKFIETSAKGSKK